MVEESGEYALIKSQREAKENMVTHIVAGGALNLD